MSLARAFASCRVIVASVRPQTQIRSRGFASSRQLNLGDRIMPNTKAQSPSDIRWFEKWDKILHPSENKPTWFTSGVSSVAFHALDKHVQDGKGSEIALAFSDDMTGKDMKYTYQELLDMTVEFSRRLTSLGIGKDDIVMVYDPKLPQAVVAMLSCARIGAYYSMVFGGASSELLARRIDVERPKAIISASCGLQAYFDIKSAIAYKPIIEDALKSTQHKPSRVILYQRDPIRCELDGKFFVEWDATEQYYNPLFAAASNAGLPFFVSEKPLDTKYSGELGPVAGAAAEAGLPVFVPY